MSRKTTKKNKTYQSQSQMLSKNKNQHKPKNNESKKDDSVLWTANVMVVKNIEEYLQKNGYLWIKVEHRDKLMFREVDYFLKWKNPQNEFDNTYRDRYIKPDGGVIWVTNTVTGYSYPIIASEAKRQGTNDERENEGKKKQAVGNAIERAQKNNFQIDTLFENEYINPVFCFIHGCDVENRTFRSKISSMSGNRPFNQSYIYKKKTAIGYKAIPSFYLQKKPWTAEEMADILTDAALIVVRYWEEQGILKKD